MSEASTSWTPPAAWAWDKIFLYWRFTWSSNRFMTPCHASIRASISSIARSRFSATVCAFFFKSKYNLEYDSYMPSTSDDTSASAERYPSVSLISSRIWSAVLVDAIREPVCSALFKASLYSSILHFSSRWSVSIWLSMFCFRYSNRAILIFVSISCSVTFSISVARFAIFWWMSKRCLFAFAILSL